MKYAFKPIAPVTLPIVNSNENFPIRRIYCVGKNYADHIIEMGGNSKRMSLFFLLNHPKL